MKKKIIYLSVILVLVISVITLSSIYKSKDNKYKKEYNTIPKEMAIMIKEEGATDYVQSNSKDIPKGNYVLNEEKTYCENNGKVTNYDSSSGSVSINFIGSDRCYLYFDYEIPDGWKTILINNGNGATTVEEAKTYIEGRTTSTTPDIYWRIIRINGDGSIRMIYSGTTAPTESTKVVMTGTGTQINATSYMFNSSRDKSEYVGYMYTLGEQHGTSTNSTIKTTIDNWYKTTTLETDLKTKSLVADQIFCNDRSPSSTQTAAWTSTGTYNYGAYGRLSSNKTPILTCPTASDKFTVNTSNGNGALTYPVGLITADEVAMAGGVFDSNNSSHYLYTNQIYWSGSPSFFNGNNAFAVAFYVYSSGNFNASFVSYNGSARPVVSLSSEARLSGNGTYSNPYTVS